MRYLVLLYFVLRSFACFGVSDETELKIDGHFELKQTSASLWTATYNLNRTVDQIMFDRVAWAYQKEAWHIPDPDFLLEYREIDGYLRAVLSRKSGKLFKSFSLETAPFSELPEKGYYAFSGFSDGGMSVYTGYFDGIAIIDGQKYDLDLNASYIPLAGNSIITREKDKLVQQFVYFGPEQAIEEEISTLIIDPLMPKDIVERTKKALPLVAKTLSGIFDFKPSTSYQVFIAGADLHLKEVSSSKGGALKRQLLFTYKGEGAIRYEQKHPEHLPIFVAHEVIHLFQHDLWPKLGVKHPWMSEGSADALAIELMLREGIISNASYVSEMKKSETGCIEGLKKTSIDKAVDNNEWRIVYGCGAVIHWLLADALEEKHQGLDLLSIWRSMALQPLDIRNQDGKVLYYQVLKSLGFTQSELDAVDRFLVMKPDDPVAALNALKTRLGVTA